MSKGNGGIEEKVKVVKKGEVNLTLLFNKIKRGEDFKKCGAVVIFLGVVRGIGHDGSPLKSIHYETDRESASKSLEEIRKKHLRNGVKEILITHVVDDLSPGEDIVYILVAAERRKEAFKVAEEIIDEIKNETPIWKKETTEKGEYWVSEVKGKIELEKVA